MKNKHRRSVMSGIGIAAVSGLAINTNSAIGHNLSENFQAKRHDLDAWMDERSGVHRIFIDTSDAIGGSNALLYANNIFNAQVDAYAGSTDDLSMIVCYRHASTAYAFNDAMWDKYGEIFYKFTKVADSDTGKAPKKNILTMGDWGINSLAKKGLQFAICNNATNRSASIIAAETGVSQDIIYKELIANAIPNSHFVPAGVMTMTRAQEYGYSLLYAS